jgi:ADP-ribosyl-[dinitrogen reductase] hydrolase
MYNKPNFRKEGFKGNQGSIDRCKGLFYGSIVGDALGGPVEFRKRGTFSEVTDMNLYNSMLGLKCGGWTDDTSMMLCLANSLIEKGSLNNEDVLRKYCDWRRNGYMSSMDYCVDIGKQTLNSLLDFENHGTLISKYSSDDYAGNGSIMRLAAVPIAFRNASMHNCIAACERSSETTHSSKICVDACRMLGCILYEILNVKHEDKSKILLTVRDTFTKEELHPAFHSIYDGDFVTKEIKSSGYVVHTLEAALYCFLTTETFKSAVLKAVNLGDDSDTVGCVTGQIAGAYYGYSELKSTVPSWLKKLLKKRMLNQVWKKLSSLKYEMLQ